MSDEMSGVWGPPTSTVDWCELNYQHTPYVAETWNTVSSLAMVAAAVLGIWLHRQVLERRFHLAFLVVAIVGLGSIAFHGTLRFQLQMLDELPMLYSALIMVYILVENRPARRFGAWFPAALAAHAVLVTSLSAFTRGTLQFYLFQISFGSMELFALVRVYLLHRRSGSREVRRLFRVGVALYLVAVILWWIDLTFCSFVSVVLPAHGLPNPQLHALWHVLVSGGLYLLTLVIAHERLVVLGRRPALRRLGGWLPHLRGV